MCSQSNPLCRFHFCYSYHCFLFCWFGFGYKQIFYMLMVLFLFFCLFQLIIAYIDCSFRTNVIFLRVDFLEVYSFEPMSFSFLLNFLNLRYLGNCIDVLFVDLMIFGYVLASSVIYNIPSSFLHCYQIGIWSRVNFSF